MIPALPRLFALRAELVERFAADRPDCRDRHRRPGLQPGPGMRLRERGIKTVHVVSPRSGPGGRAGSRPSPASVDLMLCLFPFEPKFYAEHGSARGLHRPPAGGRTGRLGDPRPWPGGNWACRPRGLCCDPARQPWRRTEVPGASPLPRPPPGCTGDAEACISSYTHRQARELRR